MEGPLSRVKSLKKSLRQSFRRIRKSRVSGKKRATPASSKVSWDWRPCSCPGPEASGLFSCCVPVVVSRGAGAWMAIPHGYWADRALRASTSEVLWLFQLQEANAQLAEQTCPHDVEMTPVQRRIEPRSADDSLSGVVRCLYFADTFLRDGEARVGTGVGEVRWPLCWWGSDVISTHCVLSYTGGLFGHLYSCPQGHILGGC